ncbi:Putative thioesterase, Acyl transferase domain superfamily, phosphopantetheine binding ACP [Septoria linicola]|uniref:Thioesterase, Acyl transferase domain superfamily, phosphopantetheine binding ACP n=1 Tax=Septoria linicola TaxID=215465 RepID=A0A9Q9EG53_9PEZI|nr:Putative thioesterase, Acyl transferase domain superfamily, phosphopantetheine binding ACP [Septoria linicola]
MEETTYMHALAFGDQTFDCSEAVSQLLRGHDDALLVDFLERACGTLKAEVSKLSSEQQQQTPRFTTLSDLVPYYRARTLNPALVQALTCVAQLGLFIREHSSGQRPYPTASDSCLTGVCTGALAAVAVSCAISVTNLIPLALHTITVAFRLGARSWELGSSIAGNTIDAHGCYASWTSAVAGISADALQEKISAYVVARGMSPLSAPHVSARVSSSACSVSAPPSILDAFLTTLSRPVVTTRLSITAPYHAAHLFGPSDVDHVVEAYLPSSVTWPRARIPIISFARTGPGASDHSDASTTFKAALIEAVRDCLIRPIALDRMAVSIANHAKACGKTYVVPYPVALSFADRLGPQVNSHLAGVSSPASLSESHFSQSTASHSRPKARSPIAIIAASGRFPSAPSMDRFWDVLVNGIDTHEIVPPSRWNAAAHVSSDPKAKNVSGTGFGCWLHEAGLFDAAYFNMSPREAPQVDPAQRLALLTAAEALEQAGIVPDRTSSTQKNRVGVWYGATSNDWMETNSAQNIDTYFIPGGNRAFIPGRVNYHFKFSGPSYTIDTACSSSLAALHLACNALWRGEVDTAIVGGTNVLTNPDMTAGLDRGHFLSRTGNCKTFDDNADGYCRGEAVVTLILKRLPDAQADSDPIQACILGVATNHSAEAESITRPHAGAQQDLFEQVLTDTGVSANDISYCEMHGTGTQAGDSGETTSVVGTLAPLNRAGNAVRPADQKLHIGAAKSNVGHGEAAAGVTSLAKVLLMLKHSKIPPHAGIKTKLNHRLPDLDARNTHIARKETSWPRPNEGKRRVLLNNFSAAGGNTCLVLEDAPENNNIQQADPRTHHIVSVSAKTSESMASNLENMIAWIDGQAESTPVLLPQLSYTTTARRVHYRHRAVATGSNLSQIRSALQEQLDRQIAGEKSIPHPPKGPSFVFGFTGQGSSFAGMGADLYQHISSFRTDIFRYDEICTRMQLPSIIAMFEGEESFSTASPTVQQLTHTCFQMALFRLWTSLGVQPKAVVGHSLGEYAALYAAGALSQVDVIHLVGQRAKLMEQHLRPGTHAMLVVRAKEDAIIAAMAGPPGTTYEFSCRNGDQRMVLGGTIEQMKHARTSLEANNIRCQYLDTPMAFHTSQVDPILEEFSKITARHHIKTPEIPIISATYGRVLRHEDDFEVDYFVKHCRNSVNMVDALADAVKQNLLDKTMIGLEIGPTAVVTQLVKEAVSPTMQAYAVVSKGKDSWHLMTHALSRMYLAGANIEWSRYHRDFAGAHKVLELPAYAWTLKEYWLQYVHDWSLRKGEAPLFITSPSLESSSIHKVVANTITAGGDGELIVDADLSREDLHPMVQGHQVYGVPLCTPSVYADVALTLGEHIKQVTASSGTSHTAVEVAEMNIQSALVANNTGKVQMLRTSARFDHKSMTATCTFSSVTEDGSKVIEQHANCQIRFIDIDQQQRELKASSTAAKTRMSALQAQVGHESNTFRFSKSMIYKMVGQLADFDEKYRGLSAITLDNDAMEATGMVSFKGIPNEGKFHTSPAYLDALSQLGGFVMNANEGVDLDKEVFVNHGWQSMRFFAKLDPGTTYHTHVKMTEGKNKLWTGDVTIYDDKQALIGVVGGVSLQGVPKRLMHYIVTAANKKVSGVGPEKKDHTATAPSRPIVQRTVASAPKSRSVVQTAVRDMSATSALIAPALEIVSEETGMPVDELKDDIDFSDAGLDSLLSLVISSRMRDQLGIDFESSQFMEIGSIGGLKAFLTKLSPPPAAVAAGVEVIKQEVIVTVEENVAPDTLKGIDIWPDALKILSEESGLVDTELTDEVSFADVGVDSLMSLVITSRLRDELDMDFPDRALFEECHTVFDLRKRFSVSTEATSSSDGSSTPRSETSLFSTASTVADDETPMTDLDEEVFDTQQVQKPTAPKQRIAPAWSMYLQGSQKRSTETLFLFPDGCGAATSYLSLPRLSATMAVVGFNSPFMKTPQNMANHTLNEVVASYIEGIRGRQPHGPYNLGGWSAGGILAYAIAQELVAAGETISSLLLIDSPTPVKGLDRLPARFFDHCTNVGLFGSELQRGSGSPTKPPEWLMPHFRASIELLHDYHAPAMKPNEKMKVILIWAGECAFDGERYAHLPLAEDDSEEDTEGMKFLTERRKDFGPTEWASLFPGITVEARVVEGEHHFSMMRDGGARRLAEHMRDGLQITA